MAQRSGRWAVAALFIGAGVLHFVRPGPYVGIVPHGLPAPRALVFVSGFFEAALGLGVLVPRWRALAGAGLLALLVAVFPANVQMLLNARAEGASAAWQAALWLRLPLQLVLGVWVHRVTRARPR